MADASGTFTMSEAVAPAQFWVYGMNSCTSLSLKGGFVGVLYAPYVSIDANGNSQFYGAATVGSFSCRGTFDFHYDTSLTGLTPPAALKILSWAEQ